MIGNLDASEKLRLTREEKNSMRVTFKNNYFMATYGENNAPFGRYCCCEEMLNDFERHQIHKVEFDSMAHYLYERGDLFLMAYIDRDS